MSRWSRIILPLALSVLLAGALAGCVGEWMESRCPATYVAASWSQPEIWDSLPEQGVYGAYNLSYHEPEGFLFEDPEWGPLVLTEVAWDPQWENAPRGSVFRLDVDERVMITTSPEKEAENLEEGFLEFISNVATAGEQTKEEWLERFVENGSRSDYTTAVRSKSGQTDEVVLVNHILRIDGPYNFEELYDGLLDQLGHEGRPDPWQNGSVELGAWHFSFETTNARAVHVNEPGRLLHVSNSEHVSFQWDPPRGASPAALEAGITRTFRDLDLGDPPAMQEMEIFSHSC